MKIRTKQFGLTLIEILVVVAVIAILVTLTVGIMSRVDAAVKERKTHAAIDLLATALEKYYSFYHEFPLIDKAVTTDKIDLAGYYSYTQAYFNDDIAKGLTVDIPASNDDRHLVNEAVYFSLNKTPVCKDILAKTDSSLITSKDSANQPLTLKITINANDYFYGLFRVNDAWKTPLRYTYDKQNDSFPLIESAGPDKIFGDGTGPGDGQDKSYSEDNITSRK